jgi:transcriptional regulator with XRE-family HTH domain
MNRDAGQKQVTRATRAVRAELNARGWTRTDLARHAGIDPDTAVTFLSGMRKPHIRTQARIEAALGWPPGTLEAINDGADPPVPHGHKDPDLLLLRRPDGLSDHDWNHTRRVILQIAQIHLSRLPRTP